MASALEEIKELLRGHTGRRDEKKILEILRSASPGDLDNAIDHGNTMSLFASVDNHLFGPDYETELMQLLTRDRLADLGVGARAAVIVGMQNGWTGSRREAAIRDVLVATVGEDLTQLKNELNATQSRHDLEGLIFDDIDSDDIRDEILAHFRASQPPQREDGHRAVKILSDIDDTAFARIHEKRYPKGALIPGVLAFYDALQAGPDGDAGAQRDLSGDLTLVTARPSDALGLMKDESRKALVQAGVRDLSVMTGSVFDIATKDSMAAKKVENIDRYAKMFPEYDLVFMGDSGQGDPIVGEKILTAHADVVGGVFIHDVVNLSQEKRDDFAAQQIWVIDTYPDAADKALELGLISAASRDRVVQEAWRELADITWDSDEQEQSTRALFETSK